MGELHDCVLRIYQRRHPQALVVHPVHSCLCRVSLSIDFTYTMGSLPEEGSVYGQRLIPHLIDDIAHNNSSRTFCSLAKSSNISDGFQDISYGTFANSINCLAWWIEENLGKSSTFETVSYIGPPDLRYIVLAIAAQKTGYKAR